MKIGVSGLAVGNRAGLGRLARVYLIALAASDFTGEIHVYLRSQADLELLRDECDSATAGCISKLQPHYATSPVLNRLLLEEWDLPHKLNGLDLDCYLGLDFTLPRQKLAPREFVVLPDLVPFTRPASVSWRARWLYRRGIRRSIRRNAVMLCISEFTKRKLSELFPSDVNSKVIYPALSPRLLNLAHKNYESGTGLSVRGSLHALSNPGPFTLSVGVSGSRKNTAQLVEVYLRAVKNREYKGSLVLVGGNGQFHTAPEDPRMALELAGSSFNEVRSSSEIYDIGRVGDKELSSLYRYADLYVSLSQEEGFGFPVLEALAHGTPALVSARSSMVEIAPGGLATTSLKADDCYQKLVSSLNAASLLRSEISRLDLEFYSICRLGRELISSLCGGDL